MKKIHKSGYIDEKLLKKHRVIEKLFTYEDLDLDEDARTAYDYFYARFKESYSFTASIFNIPEYSFYMKDSIKCNAFAIRKKGYNIIGITNSYPILLSKSFNSNHFKNVVYNFLINEEAIGLAYIELLNRLDFDFGKFMMECSIEFTLGHEFRHISQFNSLNDFHDNFELQENMSESVFDMRKHAWEFDADRAGSYNVIKYVFKMKRDLKINTDEHFKCLLFAGCASIIITKMLFYYGFIYNECKINVPDKIEFYTKKIHIRIH